MIYKIQIIHRNLKNHKNLEILETYKVHINNRIQVDEIY